MNPAEKTSLQIAQRQEQKISPRQLQSIAVLQMAVVTLAEHIQQAAVENPLLECDPPKAGEPDLPGYAPRTSPAASSVSAAELAGRADPTINGLPLFLSEQLTRRHLSAALLRCCICLVTLLDDRGYLPPEDIEDAAGEFDEKTLRDAIEVLQSLEPAGVAARDLSECLCLQLKRHHPHETLALAIAERYLPQLGQHRYREIARALQVSESAVSRAAQLIAALEPNPCGDFAPEEDTAYLQPDIVILPVDGKLTALVADWLIPHLSVSGSYRTLLKEADNPETVAYLRQKRQQAKWLIDNVQRRGETLQRCADAILHIHEPFFAGQTRELRPLTAAQLAHELGIHPSTVCRALQGKYLQCRFGIFPLSYFCTAAVADTALSRQAIEQRIAGLIAGEDAAHPLSDEAIRRSLEQGGITISRRAVTKYRNHLGIPPISLRRKRK